MPNISEKGVTPPQIQEPEEFCPVRLLWIAKENWGWNLETFAFVFGWQPSTIERWTWGQKASRAARIHAAELKNKWFKS